MKSMMVKGSRGQRVDKAFNIKSYLLLPKPLPKITLRRDSYTCLAAFEFGVREKAMLKGFENGYQKAQEELNAK